jgi:hypothetical protein
LVAFVANITIRTPEKRQAILAALRERPSFSAACRKAKISRFAFYSWRHDEPEFDADVLTAREEGLDALEDALVTRGLKNDTTAAIFMLKSHRREVYGDRQQIEHSGEIATPISTIRVMLDRDLAGESS